MPFQDRTRSAAQTRRRRASPLARLFWFCAGAVESLLDQAGASIRPDQHKYFRLGLSLVFTFLFVCVSSSYALYVALGSMPFAIALGLLWGAAIFNIDSLVVMTLRPGMQLRERIRLALPRILLAFVLSAVMAVPVELRIFRSEIKYQLAREQTEARGLARSRAAATFPELRSLPKQIESAQLARRSVYAGAEQLGREASLESDGQGGSGLRGTGKIYAVKERDHQEALGRAGMRDQELANEIGQMKARLGQAQLGVDQAVALEMSANAQSQTLLAQITALHRLMLRDAAAAGTVYCVTIVLLLFELLPILMKLLMPVGVYDRLLARLEIESEYEQTELLSMNKVAIVEEQKQKTEMSRKMRERVGEDFSSAMTEAADHPSRAANVTLAAASILEGTSATLHEQISGAARERRPWSEATVRKSEEGAVGRAEGTVYVAGTRA